MSSRALRKLKQHAVDADTSLAEEATADVQAEQQTTAPKKKNLFALLGGDDELEPQDDEQEREDTEDAPESNEIGDASTSSKKKKKKKKKGKASSAESSSAQSIAGSSSVSESGSKQQQQFANERKKAQKPENDDDDIDRILEQINQKSAKDTASSSATKGEAVVAAPILLPSKISMRFEAEFSIDAKQLDAEAELKKKFGSKIVAASRAATAGSSSGGAIRRKTYQRVAKKNVLVKPKPNWPPYERLGISMESLGSQDDCFEFAFRHNTWYQEIQTMFFQAVDTLHPDSIAHLVRTYPYHVDSLIVFSDICRHNGNVDVAADLIERALATCENTFHPQFNILAGKYLLKYARYENRAFFLALFRQIQFLGRKGCWRTAFEFTKILASLDPADPLCAIFMLDFYALRANEHQWLSALCERWAESKQWFCVPNMAMSAALAQFRIEGEQGLDNNKSNAMLRNAVCYFPAVVSLLSDHLGASSLGNSILSDPFFQAPDKNDLEDWRLTVHTLIKLYVERSHSLWKEPEVVAWLKSNLIAIRDQRQQVSGTLRELSERAQVELSRHYAKPRRAIYRHVFVSDIQTVLALIPDAVLRSSGPPVVGANGQPRTQYTGLNSHDPFPPMRPTSSSSIGAQSSGTGAATTAAAEVAMSASQKRAELEEEEAEEWIESDYERARQSALESRETIPSQAGSFQSYFAGNNITDQLGAMLNALMGGGENAGNHEELARGIAQAAGINGGGNAGLDLINMLQRMILGNEGNLQQGENAEDNADGEDAGAWPGEDEEYDEMEDDGGM